MKGYVKESLETASQNIMVPSYLKVKHLYPFRRSLLSLFQKSQELEETFVEPQA